MREDRLDTSTELGNDLSHALTGLSEDIGMDIGLRGDAADIETGASDIGTLEDRDFQALLGGIFSSAVTTRARTDNNQIRFFCHRHSNLKDIVTY